MTRVRRNTNVIGWLREAVDANVWLAGDLKPGSLADYRK